jgi:hypothetical protein
LAQTARVLAQAIREGTLMGGGQGGQGGAVGMDWDLEHLFED